MLDFRFTPGWIACSPMVNVSAPSQAYASFITSTHIIQLNNPVKLIAPTFALIFFLLYCIQPIYLLNQVKNVKNHLTSNFS